MSSTARKITPPEWDRHKDTIVELYRHKTLKDVRAEMRDQHGFNASPWQYEMQLKRWNIRKNATQKEWQQYFSNNEHHSIPASIDASGTTLPSVLLNKSNASKKRASRWVSGSLVEPSTCQASGSTLPGNAAQPIAASSSDGPFALEGGMQPDIQDLVMNVADALDGFGSVPVYTDSSFNSMVTTYERHAGSSQTFFDTVGGPAQSLNLNPTSFHVLSSPAATNCQSPFLGQDCSIGPVFTSLGIPAESNLLFFSMLKDTVFKRELPSAQLEHNLRSKGIVLDEAAAHTIFGGFAPRLIAGILSSIDQSLVRKPPNLQHFLRKLGSQVPGESSVLITNDQAFETKFARVLLFSMLNGFAGLDGVPMENILRFLNRFVVNKLLLDILEQCPRHVSRTLADNIFRAAIEATDTTVVKLLLGRKLVDANETVCFHEQGKWTPIQRASELRSLRLMKALIEAGADVNKPDLEPELPEILTAAIKSQNQTLIDFILSKAPELDPPALSFEYQMRGDKSTPIAEAVRQVDSQLPPEIWLMEFTPLGLAIQGLPDKFGTNMVAMKKFLEAGADPNGISKQNEHWTKGSPLMTALMVAVETGREDAVNMLLEYGADVNARPRIRTTRTALQYAAELGNMDMVRLLLSRGADVNGDAPFHGGATALQFAAMSGNCNMVACLLDHGAKLDALPSKIDGMWPLEGAAANGRLDVIRYLWELNVRAVAGGEFPDGFSKRQCLRAMNFARENGHIGCRDLISELSGISVQRLEMEEYGAPWMSMEPSWIAHE
ncbi:hypothetical protein INS49_007256 [Diaporthe citri]|uniref:uncharacterized protein n=1 Tax=Diaporthe citri TaxID=83186 RepID=UPI001C81A9F4|nr:uncharacterized protein INS49_007256 [Diaporthe citri]KAG6365645.1 hypothetical protein INS49_007256 [Diaporthe citri]